MSESSVLFLSSVHNLLIPEADLVEALAVGIRHSISGTFHGEGHSPGGDSSPSASTQEVPNQLEYGTYLTVPGSSPMPDPNLDRKPYRRHSSGG